MFLSSLFKMGKIIYIIMIVLTALSFSSHSVDAANNSYTTDAPEGYKEPSPMAIKPFGIVLNTGIIQQVKENNNIIVGTSINLQGDGGRDLLDFVSTGSLKYQWSEASSFNKTWHTIPSANKPSLNVNPTQSGEYWYQLDIYYSSLLKTYHLYTKVAKVTATSKNVQADEVVVDTESKYLYNRPNFFNGNSTYASADIHPDNSTEQVNWSLSDPNNLASIDNTGKLSANLVDGNSDKTGEVYVLATAPNQDFPTVDPAIGSTVVTVGGGLRDVSAEVGQNATFKIENFSNQTRIDNIKFDVSWEQKLIGEDDSKYQPIDTSAIKDNFSCTIPNITFKNNDFLYRAKIKAVFPSTSALQKPEIKFYTTNGARINVEPSTDPNVSFINKISNEYFSDPTNTDSVLNNIIAHDLIKYSVHITNNSQKTIQSSELILFLHKDTDISAITMNDDKINYQVQPASNHLKMIIDVGTFESKQSKDIEITISTPEINQRQSFVYKPTFINHYADAETYATRGSELKITYITNKIEVIPHDIGFEAIGPLDQDIIKNRLSENPVVTVDDQRRDKSPTATLLLAQEKGFSNDNGQDLPASLIFVNQDGITQDIPQSVPIPIYESLPNQTMDSPKWDKHHGLFLHIHKHENFISGGNYTSSLKWTIQNSI